MLVWCLLFSIPARSAAAASGTYGADGANVTWELTGTEGAYTLTIRGQGAMQDAEYVSNADGADTPWETCKSGITTVVVEDGVTSIGKGAFHSCSNLTTIKLPESVTSIGMQAFSGCTGLISVTLEQGVVLEVDVFSGCTAIASVTKSCDVSYDFSAFNGNAVVTLTHDSGYTYSNENGVLQEICGNQTCEQVVGTATLCCTAFIIPYDGETHEASLTFTGTLQPASGSEAGGIASERTVFYREKDTLTELSGAPAEVGSYTAYACIPVSDTKNSPQTICVDFEIKDTITAEASSPATASWQTGALISAPAGYEISTTKDGTYQATISVTDSSTSTAGTVVTYYLKETETGAFSGKKTITVLVDATAPEITGGTVTEHTASTAKVQFAVTDALSGVTACRYLLKPSAETAPTVEKVLGTQGIGAEGTGTGAEGTGTGAEGTDTQSAGTQGTAATSTQMAGAEPVVLENLKANTAYTLYVAAKDAAVTSAEWTFVPTQPEYQTTEGSVAITVTAAPLTVRELPTTATLTYHPKKHLSDVALTGGKVVPTGTGATETGATGTEPTGIGATGTGATGTETTGTQAAVSGTWSWESGSLIPTADNQGYMAVFTPTDAVNYMTAATTITITVNKAAKPATMPQTTADVSYGTAKVKDVPLPEGWAWADTDAETDLTVGTTVKATAATKKSLTK